MEWRRSCSFTVMQIEQPSEGKYDMPVVWYHAPKNAKTFRGVNAFTSGIWDRDTPAQPPELGEQPPYGYPYYGGENQWGYIGQCKVGTDDQFANGLTADDIENPPEPLPACCIAPARAGLILGDRTPQPNVPAYLGCPNCPAGTWRYWHTTISGCTGQAAIFNGEWWFGPPTGCTWPILNPTPAIYSGSTVGIAGVFPFFQEVLLHGTDFTLELFYDLVGSFTVCIGPNPNVLNFWSGTGSVPGTILVIGSNEPPPFMVRSGVLLGDRTLSGDKVPRSGFRLGDRSAIPPLAVRSGVKIGDRTTVGTPGTRSGLKLGDRSMRVLYVFMTDYLDFPVPGFQPAITFGTRNFDVLDASAHPSIMWTLYVGSNAGDGTVDFKLQQSPDGSSSWTDVPGSAIATITAANKIATIEINLAGLTPGNTFVRAVMTISVDATYFCVITQVADNSGDDPVVVQRINLSV